MSAAHSMMQKRLTSLILESFGVQSYKKATDCLRALRAESIKVRHVKVSRRQFTSVVYQFLRPHHFVLFRDL